MTVDWTEVARLLEEANARAPRVVPDTRTPQPEAQASRKEWVDTEEEYNIRVEQRLTQVRLRPREVIPCEDAVGPLAHRPLEPPASDVGAMLDARMDEG